MASRRFPQISDDALADLRRRIGDTVEDDDPHVRAASRDAIRHFAQGIGDPNPLWLDEAYARRTRWRALLAPPSFLFAASRVLSGYVGGLPGIHAMFAGAHFRWQRPIRVDDEIRSEARLKDAIEKDTKFSGRSVQQTYAVRFTNQRSELIADCDSWCFRTERDTARRRGKYRPVKPYVYSDAELERIWQDYQREEVRGNTPRHWEDVAVGEELTPVVKGPWTPTASIAFLLGWGGLYIRAHRFAFEQYRRHPALAIANEQNVPEPPERVHWDSAFARQVGVPAAYDYGPERVAWMGHLLTNWIGDDGFLCELYVEIRRHNMVGDTTWCRGQVCAREGEAGVIPGGLEDSQRLVRIDLRAENQQGETTVTGWAVASLPARG